MNNLFSVENMNEVPPFLRSGTRETDEVVIFASNKSIFSNLYGCTIKLDEHTYECAEQYIQQSKSLLFNDAATAQKIRSERDPYEIMKLGKSVRNFDKEVWQSKSTDIIRKVNLAKYSQNEQLKDALVKTGTKRLGEATAHPFFGIGHIINSKDAHNIQKWSGKNIFGKILEDIRDTLKT